MNFLNKLKKEMKDPNMSILDDEASSSEFTGYIDTECYALNAALSGDIFGGMQNNKTLIFAGESSVGKTFFTLAIVKNFLKQNPEGLAVIYDTESATTKKMMVERDIDPKRVLIIEPETIQEFRTSVLQILEKYMEQKPEDRVPMMMVLDSLGNISTQKELEDSISGNEKKDMTRAGLIRGTFRTIRLKLSKAKVPMVITNHIYAVVGAYVPTNEMSGGGGAKYAADTIVFLSKKKNRDETTKEVKGNFIRVLMNKSRMTKENSVVEVLLDYVKGLDKYYGLLPIAMAAGIFVKKAKGMEYVPTGKTVYEKDLVKNPELYYTPEVLEKINEKVKKMFLYGQSEAIPQMVHEEDFSVNPELLNE